jgi:type I restriction enzyme S subunit
LPSKFLNYFFKNFRNEIDALSSGSTVKGITIEKLKKFQISPPPLEEQKEISRRLDSLIGKEQQAKEIAEKSLAQIENLKKTILARAFRGELGTNNPAENAKAF